MARNVNKHSVSSGDIARNVNKHSLSSGDIARNVNKHSESSGDIARNVNKHSVSSGDIERNVNKHSVSSGDMARNVNKHSVSSGDIARNDICENLKCRTPHRSGFYFAGPALEGTSCGTGKWCQGGICVPMKNKKPVKVVKGGWSKWQLGECSSGCTLKSKAEVSCSNATLYDSNALLNMFKRTKCCNIGFQSRRRTCDNPKPVNTEEGCEGPSFDKVLCKDDKSCGNRSPHITHCEEYNCFFPVAVQERQEVHSCPVTVILAHCLLPVAVQEIQEVHSCPVTVTLAHCLLPVAVQESQEVHSIPVMVTLAHCLLPVAVQETQEVHSIPVMVTLAHCLLPVAVQESQEVHSIPVMVTLAHCLLPVAVQETQEVHSIPVMVTLAHCLLPVAVQESQEVHSIPVMVTLAHCLLPVAVQETQEVHSIPVMLCKKAKRRTAAQYGTTACGQFSKLLPELDPGGAGLQAPHEEARLWMGCAVFCRRKDTGTYYTPRLELNDLGVDPYFPDGTWCHNDGTNNYYCLHHHCLPEVQRDLDILQRSGAKQGSSLTLTDYTMTLSYKLHHSGTKQGISLTLTDYTMTLSYAREKEGYINRKCPRICVEGEWTTILEKTTLSTPDRDSNLYLPVIGSEAYCKSSALDHATTKAVTGELNNEFGDVISFYRRI
uniref:ADAMTS cysteine-rich domain-containing protein n=1 Tax=Timema poppense TaxID=170557 RepID=A0A7R9DFC6_TIMPO|nr:unnamed protein product [Timema poppensis]